MLFAPALAVFALISCSRYVGYGVVNWSDAELGLSAGDVVPVVIRSNISRLYVIDIPSGGESSRAELPLWQLSLYSSRKDAQRAAEEGREFNYIYASAKTDGLPVREAPDNTARQVYRLRGSEMLKVTGRGEGSPVIGRDGSPLEGEWFQVMTADGTRGWCFSYNLEVFDERDGAPVQSVAASSLEDDATLQYILGRAWYPSHYAAMLEANAVDISRVNPAWGFFPGRDSRIARVEDEEGAISFPYTGISAATGGAYRFEGTSLAVELRENGTLAVQFTNNLGTPSVRYFVALDATPAEIIQSETERRQAQIARIADAGPRFVSGNYGVFQLSADGSFLWSGYSLLVPAVIPDGAGLQGRAEIRCFLSRQLASSHDGALSLQFEGQRGWINFLYSLSGGGLRLEPVSLSNILENTVLSRDISPTVIFFRADKPTETEPSNDYSVYFDGFDYSDYSDNSEYSDSFDYSDYSEGHDYSEYPEKYDYSGYPEGADWEF